MSDLTMESIRHGNGERGVERGIADENLGANVPGIVIADGGVGLEAGLTPPRLIAFVYGEEFPHSPTLPFGRWRQAS